MEKSLIEQFMPDIWDTYLAQVRETMKDGALSAKMKELTAVALSIAVHCEPCIKVHIRRAKEKGATKEEIAEILAVVLMMCGGPSDVWTRKIIADVI